MLSAHAPFGVACRYGSQALLKSFAVGTKCLNPCLVSEGGAKERVPQFAPGQNNDPFHHRQHTGLTDRFKCSKYRCIDKERFLLYPFYFEDGYTDHAYTSKEAETP